MAVLDFAVTVRLLDLLTAPLKSVRKNTDDVNKSLYEAKQRVDELNKAQKNLDGLKKLQNNLEKTKSRIADASTKLDVLKERMAATTEPSERLTKSFASASRALDALKLKQDRESAALDGLRSKLQAAHIPLSNLEDAQRHISSETESANKALENQKAAMDRLVESHQRFQGAANKLDSFRGTVRETAHEFSGLATKLIAAKTAMAALSSAVVGLAPVLAQMGASAGMAFGAALATTKVAAMSKELTKFSETTGASAQALQEWRIAGQFEGIKAEFGELGDISKVFGDLNEQMSQLGTKKGEDFAKSLGTIGLKAQDIKKLKPDEALLKIGEALGKSKLTESQRATFLADISDDAAKLLPLLEKNSQSFAEIQNYANSVGAIQSPEQLERMKQTSRELSFWKLGMAGVGTQLAHIGGNVVNTLGPNVRKLFVDAKGPIAEWSKSVGAALAQFKADLDDTGSWGTAFARQLQSMYPTLYGFLAGAADFGRGYGQAFVVPMLDSLKSGYARIADAMGGGDGIESKGRALGEMMRPMTAIIDEVTKAIAFLIENFRFMSKAMEISPLKLFLDSLTYVRSALDTVGEGVKWLGQALGLIDPNSTASGFTVLLSTLAGLAASALASKLVLGALGAAFNFVSFAVGPLVTAFKAVRLVFTGLSLLASANPFVLAAVAIAGVAYLIYSNWEPISAFFSGLLNDITAMFGGSIGDITALFSGSTFGIDGVLGTIAKLLSSFPNPLQPLATMFLSFQGTLGETGDAVQATGSMLMTAFAGVAPGFAALAAGEVSIGNLVSSFDELRSARGLLSQFTPHLSRLGSSLGVLGRALQVARIAVSVFSMALRANPIGLAVTAIAGAAMLIYANWGKIVSWWNSSKLKEQVMPIATAAIDYAKNKWTQLKNWWDTSTLAQKALGIATAPLQIARTLAADFFNWWLTTELGQKALNIATGAIDWARGKMQGFLDWWNNLSLKSITASIQGAMPSWMGGGGGEAKADGARASGGPVRAGGIYRVNELGPELLRQGGNTYLMADRDSNVIPLSNMVNRTKERLMGDQGQQGQGNQPRQTIPQIIDFQQRQQKQAAQEVKTSGVLNIKIDSKEPVRVTQMKSTGMQLNVHTGPIGAVS